VRSDIQRLVVELDRKSRKFYGMQHNARALEEISEVLPSDEDVSSIHPGALGGTLVVTSRRGSILGFRC
jgi:hypothetical protein